MAANRNFVFEKKIIENEKVIAAYFHGSRVYGCNTPDSDYDLILVINVESIDTDYINCENYDMSLYTKGQWDIMAQENDCDFMECIFLRNDFKLKEEYVPAYTIDVNKIRSNFSKKASNSFVKCKKKLTISKDYAPYIGKKSLFHSFRLLQFGIQILKEGRIIDYGSANSLYQEIVENDSNDWNYFKETYQQKYNQYKSEFRLAEKERMDKI